ncbi:MAG: ABC transporter substrate-binding protein [Lautropia sp.]|nr:ABC transporter substrate-binding protein [Lautropia sp.]
MTDDSPQADGTRRSRAAGTPRTVRAMEVGRTVARVAADSADRRHWLKKGAMLLGGTVAGTVLGVGAGLFGSPTVGATTSMAPGAGTQGRGSSTTGGSSAGKAPSAASEGAGSTAGASAAGARRIVSMGGTLTEIIYALGAGDRVVGVDRSSFYPPEAKKLPHVGYFRRFSVEGVASLQPDLVIAGAESGPPSAVHMLKGLGVRVELIELKPELSALLGRIDELAALLGRQAAGDALAARIRAQVERATAVSRPRRVLALSNHVGKLQGAGRDTAIDTQLRMLGATNLLAESHRSYKPVSAESVASLRPDVIVTSRMTAPDGMAAFRQQPGVAGTPAGRLGHIVLLDNLLMLGFGPRVGESLQQLSDAFADWGAPAGTAAQEH